MDFLKKYGFLIPIGLMAIGMVGLVISCKSLKVYNIEGELSPCNKMYTQMDFDIKKGNKTTTLVTLWQIKCSDAMAEIKKAKIVKDCDKVKKDCKRWIFQGKDIDKKDYKNYAYYMECIAPLKKVDK